MTCQLDTLFSSFLQRMRRSTWQRLKIPLLIVGLILWIAWNNGFVPFPSWSSPNKSSQRKATDEKGRKERDIEEAIFRQSGHVVAEECSPLTGQCYTIIDDVRRIHGKIVAQRLMRLDSLPGYIFTAVNLRRPDVLTWKNSLVSKWPVDKMIVDSEYCQVQIGIGFITEAMSFDSQEKQQVLMIGLGGGISSSFLSVLPEMDIKVETTVVELDPYIVVLARKYFGHKNVTGLTNVVVADGLKFLRKAVKNKKKYRSILLDACYSNDETTTGLLCPVKEFLDHQVIQNMYDSLEDGGVVSVNTISKANAVRHERLALEQFQKIFPSCYLAPYQYERNMLVCSKKAQWTWKEQRTRFSKNLEDVIHRFDFQHLGYLRRYGL